MLRDTQFQVFIAFFFQTRQELSSNPVELTEIFTNLKLFISERC